MAEEMTLTLIKEFGVPVAAFVMMFWLFVNNQKWQREQQEKSEERYVNLVNCFINTVKEITESNTKALEGLTMKLDDHTKSKNDFMEFIKDERRMHA